MIDAHRLAALLFTVVIPGISQTDKSPEVTSRDTPVTFNSKVSLVTVPVVVRDAKGRAIGDLRKEDFQLFDKGKPQTISKFSIEKAEATAGPLAPAAAIPGVDKEAERAPANQPPPNRFVAYLFDDMHLNVADLMAVREAAIKYLNESMRPADRAAIYTTSGQNMLEFTSDKEKLKETINRLAPKSKSVREAKPCPEISEYMADQILNFYPPKLLPVDMNDSNVLWAAVQEVLACGRGGKPEQIGGKPSIDDMPIDLFNAINEARSAALRVYNIANENSQISLAVLKNVVKRMSAMPGQRTIVLASSGFLVLGQQPMELEIVDQAIRSRVIVNTLDARGIYTVIPYGDTATTTVSMKTANINNVFRPKAAQAQSEVLAEIADATGGTYFHNNNDLHEGFRLMAGTPEFTYVLGFAPQIAKNDGSYHSLKVTVKEIKGVTVAARHGYFALKHSTDPTADAKEEISAAVFSSDEIADIPVEMHTQFFKVTNQTSELTVLAHIDLTHLHFKKSDGRSRNTLSSVSAVFDRNGILVGAVQKEIDLQLRDETFAARVANGILLKANFDVAPGSYVVRVVVRDSLGQNMAAQNTAVEIP